MIRWPVLGALCLFLSGCSGAEDAEPDAASESMSIRSVATPAATGSGEPNLTLGADGEIYLSWIEPAGEGHALRFSRWVDDAWNEPRTIATGDDWFVNWADFPSMAALEDGTLAAHWLQKSGPDTYAYDVMLSLSHDGGATWSEPFRPHDDGTETEHGFVTIEPAGPDRFALVWLDGRETGGGHGHDEGAGGPMTLRGATLTADGTITDGVLLDARTCDCCPTDVVRTESGELIVVYRDRGDTEIRDIYTVRHTPGGWTDPVAVHDDGWTIAGCPVNGPTLDAVGSRVACAWFTVSGETQGEVRVAFSGNGGASFGSPVRIDDGKPMGRTDLVMLGDGSALVCWMEEGRKSGEIRIRRVRASGPDDDVLVAAKPAASRASGFPRLVRRGDLLILAWTEPDTEETVRTGVLTLGE